MSTAITTTAPEHAYEPTSIEQAYKMADTLVQSGMLPKSVRNAAGAFAIMAAGRELGMTTMQAFRSIHIIEGRVVLSADLMVALAKRSGECEYFRLVSSDANAATYETMRRGNPSPTTLTFTIEDANRAGLTGKDTWKKYPAAMLRARCSAALVRAEYPDTALGMYDPDEISVEEPPRRVEKARAIIDVPAVPKEPVVITEENDVDQLTNDQVIERIRAAASQAEITNLVRVLDMMQSRKEITREVYKELKDRARAQWRELKFQAEEKAKEEAEAILPEESADDLRF